MSVISNSSKVLSLVALLAVPASVGFAAQPQDQAAESGLSGTVTDTTPDPASMTKGPQIKGMISARSADKIQVTTVDGNRTVIAVNDNTQVKSSGGFLGMSSSKLTPASLLNGLPVTVDTLQSGGGLYASKISVQNKDMRTAAMIRNGTDQRFAEQTAATEALRSRVADIGNYNIKSTTNVNFDTGKAVLSEQGKADLCTAANQAQGMNNALLLVVGYTDSTGSEELNQALSEKRASRVVNYLQQACGWKPYRMLTPTGMAEADPAADNTTAEGKAQNRRVAVNVLVSKGLDGM
ncbi:OmpA family protein [Novosphingobium sp. G106]|uniref:OmpA family protein n=1 Tax=Novosphingobium sp. G106 TaxID=2849500 RepID=UPI001C2D35B5|nr:OmpA family protein [Novosphingobium sp. G106]MBV1688849.1 OmpA family protein [Novosphingobium sp. G106]